MLQLAAAVLFVALLMASPSEALAAARQAIAVWAGSFLPALLPFFAVTPALSSDEAARLYAKFFGRAFECLFGCPGQLSGAAMIGLMAGSPAGAIAAGRLRGHATGAELTRGALLASGVSPGFMLSAVGAAMLGDARLGPDQQLRFLPTRFSIEGAAIDPRGFACQGLACPRCHLPVPRALLEMDPLFLSILGAPGSGKSYFLTAMTWALRQTMP